MSVEYFSEGKGVGQNIDDAQWYALRVIPQKEYIVGYMLERREAWAYVPTGTSWRKRTRYAQAGTEYAKPEMPGCIFARFPAEPAWYDLLKNHLILGPLGRNGAPWRFRERELYMYFARTPNGTLVKKRGERPQVSFQGRLLRAPTTNVKTISKRRQTDENGVVEPTAQEAAILGPLAIPSNAVLLAA